MTPLATAIAIHVRIYTCMDGDGTWMAMVVAKGHTIHRGPTYTFPKGLLERPLMMGTKKESSCYRHRHQCTCTWMAMAAAKGTIFLVIMRRMFDALLPWPFKQSLLLFDNTKYTELPTARSYPALPYNACFDLTR